VESVVSTNLDQIARIDNSGKGAVGTATGNGIYYARTAGGLLQSSVEDLPASMLVTGPWNLSVGQGSKPLEELTGWTEFPEFENFSGTAVACLCGDLEIGYNHYWRGDRRRSAADGHAAAGESRQPACA